MGVVLSRNTEYPTRAMKVHYTVDDNQTSVHIRVCLHISLLLQLHKCSAMSFGQSVKLANMLKKKNRNLLSIFFIVQLTFMVCYVSPKVLKISCMTSECETFSLSLSAHLAMLRKPQFTDISERQVRILIIAMSKSTPWRSE